MLIIILDDFKTSEDFPLSTFQTLLENPDIPPKTIIPSGKRKRYQPDDTKSIRNLLPLKHPSMKTGIKKKEVPTMKKKKIEFDMSS